MIFFTMEETNFIKINNRGKAYWEKNKNHIAFTKIHSKYKSNTFLKLFFPVVHKIYIQFPRHFFVTIQYETSIKMKEPTIKSHESLKNQLPNS